MLISTFVRLIDVAVHLVLLLIVLVDDIVLSSNVLSGLFILLVAAELGVMELSVSLATSLGLSLSVALVGRWIRA